MGIILPSQLGPCKKRFWEFCAHTNSDSVTLPQKTGLNIKGQDMGSRHKLDYEMCLSVN